MPFGLQIRAFGSFDDEIISPPAEPEREVEELAQWRRQVQGQLKKTQVQGAQVQKASEEDAGAGSAGAGASEEDAACCCSA